MESDYAYRMFAVVWARCLLEWARVCNTPAFGYAGSSPAAPIRCLWRRVGGLNGVARWALCSLIALARWMPGAVVWILETPVFPYWE